MRRLTTPVLVLALLILGAGATTASAKSYYWTESDGTVATYVYRYQVTVPHCVLQTFKTQNLAPYMDTVMWIVDAATNQEVAWNDDFQGAKSQITYMASCTGPDEPIYVWVRAKSNDAGGNGGPANSFEFVHNSTSLGYHRLGGYILKTGNVTSATDTMQTVFVNNGAQATRLLRFTRAADGHYQWSGSDTQSGVGTASKLGGLAATDEMWVVATTGESLREGPVRVVRNDAVSGDTDVDHLGNGLENETCTCSTSSNPTGAWCATTCSGVSNKQDTDGDGLEDDWEVVGYDDAAAPQSLVLWGASALHKDLFVEFDLEHDTDAAAIETTLIATASKFTSLPIANIDGINGIAFHADRGGTCSSEAGDVGDGLTSICGDFGGASIAPTWRSCHDNLYGTGCPPGGQPCGYMAGARIGKFHWMQRTSSTSQGSTPTGSDCSQISDSNGANAPSRLIAHELGHQLGLQHWGQDVAGVANRKATYPSLMNYAYDVLLDGSSANTKFSSGALASYPLNPVNLSETSNYGGTASIGFLVNAGTSYAFPTDPSSPRHVDWNRDGAFDSSVRAHVQGEPEHHDYGGSDMPANIGQVNVAGLTPSAGVGATYVGGYTYVIGNASGVNTLSFARRSTGSWSAWTTLANSPSMRSDCGPAAATYTVAGTDYLYVLCIDASTGKVHVGRFDSNAVLQGNWDDGLPPGGIGLPAGVTAKEVSVVAAGSRLYVVIADTQFATLGQLWMGWFEGGTWTAWSQVTVSGGPVESRNFNREFAEAPGLASGPDADVYMLTRNPYAPGFGKYIILYKFDPASGVWDRSYAADAGTENCEPRGRIASTFRYYRDANGANLARGTGAIWWWYNAVCSDQGEHSETLYRWTWGTLSASTQAFDMGRWHRTPLGENGACFAQENFEGPAIVNHPDGLAAFVPHVQLTCSSHTTQPTCVAEDGCKWNGTSCFTSHCASPGVLQIPHADGEAQPAHLLGDYDDASYINANLCGALHSADCSMKCSNFINNNCAQQEGELIVCDQDDTP